MAEKTKGTGFLSKIFGKNKMERGYTAKARPDRSEKVKTKIKQRDLGDVMMTKKKTVLKDGSGIKKTVTKTFEPKPVKPASPSMNTGGLTRSYIRTMNRLAAQQGYDMSAPTEEGIYDKDFYAKRTKDGKVMYRSRTTPTSSTVKTKVKKKTQPKNTPRY